MRKRPLTSDERGDSTPAGRLAELVGRAEPSEAEQPTDGGSGAWPIPEDSESLPLPGVLSLGLDGIVTEACGHAAAALSAPRDRLVGSSLVACLARCGLTPPDELAQWPSGLLDGHAHVARVAARASDRALRLSLLWRAGDQAYILVEDLSPYLRIERRLSTASAKLERLESLTLRQEAAGPIAHDLSNVLTAVAGEVSVALMRGTGWDPQRTLLRIEGLAERAIDLARRIGRRPRAREPAEVAARADVSAVLRAMESSLRCCLEPGHELRLVLAEGACRVPLRPRELERIVLNLVVNARDAMAHHGTLTLRPARSDDGSVELTVSDTGEGMPNHVEARAFEPLYTTKPDGTGLGLAVIQRMILDAGGRIALETAEGVGTTVRIALPEVDATHEATDPT